MTIHRMLIFTAFISAIAPTFQLQINSKEECSCQCSQNAAKDSTICETLSRFEKELSTVKDAIEYRTRYINDITELKEKLEWQDYVIETLSQQVESLKFPNPQSPSIPPPEALVRRPEEEMQGDSSGSGTRTSGNARDLENNVSTLVAKVEEVENMTKEFHEELMSERRVRRHIEEDLNEARSSIKLLGDKFLNLSFPGETNFAEVEEIVFHTFDSLNKTLENHLQKLLYKVDNVAYKNETKNLDERLENVEIELLSGYNISSIQNLSGELKQVSKVLSNLNETLEEKLAEEELRIDAIEAKANKVDELTPLTNQLQILQNASNLMQSGVTDLWQNLQDVKNYTNLLQNEFETQITRIRNNTLAMEQEELLNLTSEIDALKDDFSKAREHMLTIEKNMKFLSADVTVTESMVHDLSMMIDNKFKDIDLKLDNLTYDWMTALEIKTQEILANNSKKLEELKRSQRHSNIIDLNEDYENEVGYNVSEDEDGDFEFIFKDSEKDKVCTLPTNANPHLHIIMENDIYGLQQLRFFCIPIGQYILNSSQSSITCVNGKWIGSLPTCQKLLTEIEVTNLAEELSKKNPCESSIPPRKFPDQTNCSRFFECWRGKAERFRCRDKFYFDTVSNVCLSETMADCASPDSTTELLMDLIPTIIVEPGNMDKPYSLMGTSNFGQLVVYPMTSFKLHCIYPDNMWGPVRWTGDREAFNPSSTLIMSYKSQKSRVTASVVAAKQNNGGIYTCFTPFGREHSITVVVKNVTCPPIYMDTSTNQDVIYGMIPEGKYRVLSTVALFLCDGGRNVSALCLANGEWSRSPPSEQECPPRMRPRMPWTCPHIDISSNPLLVLEPKEDDKVVLFRCAGETSLIGSPYTRCMDDGSWSHHRLPRCMSRTII